MPSTSFLSLPPEVIAEAAILSNPNDVAALSCCCRHLYDIIYSTSFGYIWRRLYLATFDNPKLLVSEGVIPHIDFDWKYEVQRRAAAENLFMSNQLTEAASSLQKDHALEALASTIQWLAPSKIGTVSPTRSSDWCHEMSCGPGGHTLLKHLTSAKPSTVLVAFMYLSAFAHLEGQDTETTTFCHLNTRNQSRAFVYDMKRYTKLSRWAPLLPDGTGHVNWEHIVHLMVVMIANLRDLSDFYEVSPPLMLESVRPLSAPGIASRSQHDWAGVEGKWIRIVSFMDYPDLMGLFISSPF
jgi:hypothetical protein